MSFIVEFQPQGFRLFCEKSLTLLDAAREADISLRADCGGEGICGKCQVQILSSLSSFSPTDDEIKHINKDKITQGFRLACETVLNDDVRVYIPSFSAVDGQTFQIDGLYTSSAFDPPVSQKKVDMNPASLTNLDSDFSQLKKAVNNPKLTTGLSIIQTLPKILRDNNWVLNLLIRGNCLFHITEKQMEPLLGLAVDVGSTKLAFYLVNLPNGKVLAAKGILNPQIAYGEDIMARLAYAMRSKKKEMHLHILLMDAINHTASEMCAQIGTDPTSIADLCLVGNTAMHHFFLYLPTASLSVSPFVPVLSDALEPLASDIGLLALPGSCIYAPPVIAGFVGSDHLAFLLAAGFGQKDCIQLGIDIGTNTEIALQKGKRIVSISTASGPAFEGAHIQFGMRAAPGAIDHVHISSNGKIHINVIGGKQPIGICGSGILDAVAEMRERKILNHRGRIEKISEGVKLDSMGKPYFFLTQGDYSITLSQQDIDQILLAKGAIRAGIDVLMHHLNVQTAEIEQVLIAGAFGSFLNLEHAMRIGMLPNIPIERVKAVGNAAGAGARMMLVSQQMREQAESLAKRIEYLELTVYPDFPLYYARGIQS